MATERFTFTTDNLEQLPAPKDAESVLYADEQTNGLAIRVRSTGTKSFYFTDQFGAFPRQKNLGRFPSVSLEEARAKARQISLALSKAQSPWAKARPEAPSDITLEQLFELYMDLHAKIRCKTASDMQANFLRYLNCFASRTTSSITRVEVQNWVNTLGITNPHTANRSYDLLRAIINWGIKKEIITHRNPCLGIDKYLLKPRDRFVQPGDEFERVAAAINAEIDLFRDFFWICLFTGARRGNILSMRWEDVNLDAQTWRIPDTKNGDAQFITLIPQAVELLGQRKLSAKGPWVFTSPKNSTKHCGSPKAAWQRIRRLAQAPDLRIHDLRRTLGSYMAIQGVSPTIIGKALGHRSPASTAIYARLTQDPVRNAIRNALAHVLTDTNRQSDNHN
jgi:integrase